MPVDAVFVVDVCDRLRGDEDFLSPVLENRSAWSNTNSMRILTWIWQWPVGVFEVI
jgi:hypothetical protein